MTELRVWHDEDEGNAHREQDPRQKSRLRRNFAKKARIRTVGICQQTHFENNQNTFDKYGRVVLSKL